MKAIAKMALMRPENRRRRSDGTFMEGGNTMIGTYDPQYAPGMGRSMPAPMQPPMRASMEEPHYGGYEHRQTPRAMGFDMRGTGGDLPVYEGANPRMGHIPHMDGGGSYGQNRAAYGNAGMEREGSPRHDPSRMRMGGDWEEEEDHDSFGEEHQRGRGKSSKKMMDMETAEEWTAGMHNADGTKGPHWNVEQVRMLMDQKPDLKGRDLATFYAVLNMLYSDYGEVAKRHGANTLDFYIAMAKAWMDDTDASTGKAKTRAYYDCVVK